MWVSTREVLAVVGFSRQHLYNLKNDYLKEGIHYRNISRKNAIKPRFQWHLKNIEKFLATEAKKRG